MPPSSQLILDLLAKSVARVNSQGEKRGRQEAGEGCNTNDIKKRTLKKGEDDKNIKKALDVDKPEEKESNEDMIRSLVHNHLKKVSPKLVEKFSSRFTFVQSSLKLESVVGSQCREVAQFKTGMPV